MEKEDGEVKMSERITMPIPSSVVALIPARSGSKRVEHKNIKPLCGHPLIAYTIAAALESGVFGRQVFVSSDSTEYLQLARIYGAKTVLRPEEMAKSWSPDVEWVRHALSITGSASDCFSILRPTSPFRSAATIRQSWEEFVKINRESAVGRIDSLRALRRVRERPEKMWRLTHPSYLMTPYLAISKERELHSQQYFLLEQRYGQLYVQTSSLEVAWCDVIEKGSIAGIHVYPFMQEGYEGFAIDTPEEWDFAEWLAQSGKAVLPVVPLRESRKVADSDGLDI